MSSNGIIGTLSNTNHNLNFTHSGTTRMFMPSNTISSQRTVSIGSSSANPYYYRFEVNKGRTALIGDDGNDQINLLQIISGYNSPNVLDGNIHYMNFSHERFDNNEEHGVINTIQYQNPGGPAVSKHMLLQKVSGNLGIGYFNNAPTEKLEVIGNIKASGDLIFNNGTSLTQALIDITNGVSGSSGGSSGSSFWVDNNNNQIGYGNVYVSNTGGTPYLTIKDNNSDAGTRLLQVGNDAFLTDVDQGNTLGIFGVQNSSQATILLGLNGSKLKSSNGNLSIPDGVVTIGTDSVPNNDYALRVNGKILAKGLKIQVTGWPDYVFEPDYKLMPLSELKAYISENKHLPNVPSQATVEKEGIEVEEVNKVLLEKVEELTLYIMDLESRIQKIERK